MHRFRKSLTFHFPARPAMIGFGVGLAAVSGGAVPTVQAQDAYIKARPNRWTMGTSRVEKTVALEGGRLVLKSLRNKSSGHEMAAPGALAQEFSVGMGSGAADGPAGGVWKLIGATDSRGKQGELQLDLTLQRGALRVTKSYVVYPQSSIIREWATFANMGSAPLQISDPGFLSLAVKPGASDALDFHWMTGGENQPGSWLLKTEALSVRQPRRFDSYDPFPSRDGGAPGFPGDGVGVKILLNDRQIWPAQGWQPVANATVSVPFDVRADVKPGDRLVFLVNKNGNISYDTTRFDPTIAYEDGETHTASKEFSGAQNGSSWRYAYLEGGKYVDLVFYPGPRQWRKATDNPNGVPFVGVDDQHPDEGQDAARIWTASRAGGVRISGAVSNSGNRSARGFRPGSASYAPWYALYNRASHDGLFIGWDYFGHWTSSFSRSAGGSVVAQMNIAGHRQTLAPRQSVTTPRAFVGLFRDDLDNAGNECLDWQYRYLWDYTRDGWFPAIRMLGYWFKGTGWQQPGVGWTGGNPDWASTYRKVFRVADLMSYVGADVYHRDWGWWDRAGDWNGPDFRSTGDYLRKRGMGQLIYAFLYTVDFQSRVAREHPDWIVGAPAQGMAVVPWASGSGVLDMSRPEVVSFIRGQLDDFQARWGDFEWRNDSLFTGLGSGDDTPLLAQDEGFRQVLKGFLDKHPRSAFQAVNFGGNYVGYDYTRYASSTSFSDGSIGPLRNYYASLMLPPDKTSDIPDIWNPDAFDKATWRGLLCFNFDMTGDTWQPQKLEGLRELIDIYHYLQSRGVVGRWVHVFRPQITGDDPTMYFQRLSRDGLRGIIIPKRRAPNAVTIKPKGLLPGAAYTVSFHEAGGSQKRSGAELMANGIRLEKMAPGELIYLNLPLHPGSKADTLAPTAPRNVTKRRADNMEFPGVEVSWQPGRDNNWISYYQVLRDGEAIDKVAKGRFYFDHSAGADLAATYAVRAVDGAGNASAPASTPALNIKAARIWDDAPTQDGAASGLVWSGGWQRATSLQPAHRGTISLSNQKGAAVEVAFEGKRVLWFTKLGANCGRAQVSIDGGAPEIVDTYSADDIWGIGIYRKEFAAAGRHTLRISVLGEHAARATDSLVHVDGVRVEQE